MNICELPLKLNYSVKCSVLNHFSVFVIAKLILPAKISSLELFIRRMLMEVPMYKYRIM